eukprot:6977-Heterococcus_DN1.PRE.2
MVHTAILAVSTYDATVSLVPVCTCGVWYKEHMNTIQPLTDQRMHACECMLVSASVKQRKHRTKHKTDKCNNHATAVCLCTAIQ